uniref:non-specific serine/threonine protein kinase n=1 Tax=Kalanchoe fedtschenkoi TaxID=63787 RepID=A0A7N0U585_KALFE
MARGLKQRAHLNLTPLLLILLLPALFAAADPLNEAQVLLKFKTSLSNSGKLNNWDASKTPCNANSPNWHGVLCSNGKVHGLQLESMGLSGTVDIDSLTKLPDLRTLSLMNNQFEGSLPAVNKLGALKSLYLSYNKFGGEITSNAFEGMSSLKKVHLAGNKFVGAIPSSLAALPKLLELKLQGNQFGGEIPNFVSKDLKSLDLSNNALSGPIPTGLQKFGTAPFEGNKNLCGGSLQQCLGGSADKKETSKKTIIITAAVIVGVALIIIIACLIMPKKHVDSASAAAAARQVKDDELEQMERGSTHSSTSSRRGDQNKLSFLRDDGVRFDMPDLLKASAEILGSGYFGSSYKANLLSGKSMVVKRFRHMNNLPREEFHEHMRRLGRLNHPNLHPISAYYYRKEEKLLVTEFVPKGSLAASIHSKHNQEKPSLDWQTRLRVIKGVANGLSYLYTELPSLTSPHGHLKSSNVLLNDSYEPLLNDYGLVPIINQEHAQEHMISYKAPEYTQHGRITKKTDVWCFGILILETLTGRFPANFLQQGKGTDDQPDLPTWVRSMILEEEKTGEVFEKDMGWSKSNEGEMVKLLKIGLACCESDVDKRWDLKEAVERIEEVKESSSDKEDEFFSTRAAEKET